MTTTWNTSIGIVIAFFAFLYQSQEISASLHLHRQRWLLSCYFTFETTCSVYQLLNIELAKCRNFHSRNKRARLLVVFSFVSRFDCVLLFSLSLSLSLSLAREWIYIVVNLNTCQCICLHTQLIRFVWRRGHTAAYTRNFAHLHTDTTRQPTPNGKQF